MPADRPLLNVNGLTVVYGVSQPLRAVSFQVASGEIVGLTGDSGSGKSTLALALLGLVRAPGEITAGSVRFDGTDLLALPEHERRERRGRDIGLIVQNPRASLSPLHSIGTQIDGVVRAHTDLSRKAARARGIGLLRTLGLNDPERRAHAYPHEISGGMAQRVLIAMALGAGPRLLVADEPTSGLDVTIQAQFLDDMWRTVRRAGSAMLLMTQDLGIIANYCDRVLVMEGGRIVAADETRRYFAAPADAFSRAILDLRHEHATPVPQPAALLDVRDLTKTFRLRGSGKRLQAVSRVSLMIGRGETLGLVGESGSGKTTVGRCLLRLVEPDEGTITFDGSAVDKASTAELRRFRRKMQIVFQDPLDALDPRWTVGQIINEALEHRDERRIAELLGLVGLDAQTARARPRTLSGGAQQRVGIARAIAANPGLVVLDEPTSMLTPLARVDIIRLLRDLQTRLGMSYLFISHDLSTVEHLCHRVAVMYLGQIVEIGTRAQVFGAPMHPYTRALLSAHLVPDPDARRVDREQPEALAGEIPSPVDLPRGCYLAGRCPDVLPSCRDTAQPLQSAGDGRYVRCTPAVSATKPPLEPAHA